MPQNMNKSETGSPTLKRAEHKSTLEMLDLGLERAMSSPSRQDDLRSCSRVQVQSLGDSSGR